jgi:hypothetical protein
MTDVDAELLLAGKELDKVSRIPLIYAIHI